MSQLSVCAILLTADRPELTRKAVACFKMQTASCERAGIKPRLLILDTSECAPDELLDKDANVLHVYRKYPFPTVGQLRNVAIATARDEWSPGEGPDILIHWDSDDHSHPSRISEQVALLQSSGADCVGFSDLLFWREIPLPPIPGLPILPEPMQSNFERERYRIDGSPGEAWLYTSPGPKPSPPGTTLCYTREFWIRNPFPATSQGEELRFLSQAKCVSVSSIGADSTPRMIARIHPGNTSTAYDPRKMAAESKRKNPAWQRVPMWDSYCAETMR